MATTIRLNVLAVLILLLSIQAALAQITISDNDILALKGTSREILSTGLDTIFTFVTIGPGGTNQIWDYRNVIIDDFIAGTLLYADAAGGNRADLFPTANFRQRISAQYEGSTFIFDTYMNVTSNQLLTLGRTQTFGGAENVQISDDAAPLPLIIGSSWFSALNDTNNIAGFITITEASQWSNVDASGTLRISAGDFDCLRIRQFSRRIITTIFAGIPFSIDTTESVSFTWISKEHMQTLSVDSTEDGMGTVNQVVSGETGTSVSGSGVVIKDFVLNQNYPNPFNPATSIEYRVGRNEYVSLKVYDLLGREVATLVDEFKPAGSYEVEFDAAELSSGIYFYKIQAGSFNQIKKMILLR
jgi:hypothetical protein